MLTHLYFVADFGKNYDNSDKPFVAASNDLNTRIYDAVSDTKDPMFAGAKAGINGLLQLISKHVWVQIELDAWRIFSDAFVKGVPCLSSRSRRCLFSHMISENAYCEATKLLILRALHLRLATFFESTAYCLEDIGTEEIVAMHRLTVVILRSIIITHSIDPNRLSLLAIGRDAFLRSVLTTRDDHSLSQENVLSYQTAIIDKSNSCVDCFAMSWSLLETLTAQLESRLAFNYTDPVLGFDRSKVRGMFAKLIQVQNPDHATALKVVEGGKLFQVVVDEAITGKAILDRGKLQQRITIFPLDKIQPRRVTNAACVKAQELASNNHATAWPAIELVGFNEDVRAVMEWSYDLFG